MVTSVVFVDVNQDFNWAKKLKRSSLRLCKLSKFCDELVLENGKIWTLLFGEIRLLLHKFGIGQSSTLLFDI